MYLQMLTAPRPILQCSNFACSKARFTLSSGWLSQGLFSIVVMCTCRSERSPCSPGSWRTPCWRGRWTSWFTPSKTSPQKSPLAWSLGPFSSEFQDPEFMAHEQYHFHPLRIVFKIFFFSFWNLSLHVMYFRASELLPEHSLPFIF